MSKTLGFKCGFLTGLFSLIKILCNYANPQRNLTQYLSHLLLKGPTSLTASLCSFTPLPAVEVAAEDQQ